MMRVLVTIILLFFQQVIAAQMPVDLKAFSKNNGAQVTVANEQLSVSWPVNKDTEGRIILNLSNNLSLIKSLGLTSNGTLAEIGKDLQPAFLLTVGKRDLVSQN